MQPALELLALIKPDEVQPRQAIRLRADLELLIRGVDHNPAKSRSPPLPQGHRIHRVNNYLFPFQGHPPSLVGQPGLRKQALEALGGKPCSGSLVGLPNYCSALQAGGLIGLEHVASSLSGKSGGRATITAALCADFHDLRHAGNQFVAQARANLSELMETHGSR